jgi:hypothetical protein
MITACGDKAPPPDQPADATPTDQPQQTPADLPTRTTCDEYEPQWGRSTATHSLGTDYTLKLTAERTSIASEPPFDNGRVSMKVNVTAGLLDHSGFKVAAGDSFCVVIYGQYPTGLKVQYIPFKGSKPVLPSRNPGVRVRIHATPHQEAEVAWEEEYNITSDGTLLPLTDDTGSTKNAEGTAKVKKMQGSCGSKGCCSPKKAF